MPISIPRFLSGNKNHKPIDPKPVHVRIELPDGQFHEWDLGPGDAIGYGPLRVDTLTRTLVRKRNRINISFIEER